MKSKAGIANSNSSRSLGVGWEGKCSKPLEKIQQGAVETMENWEPVLL
jgi:hypothetical protein